MPKAKRGPGRPKMAKGQAKESFIPIRVSPEDRKLFEKAAKASDHKTISGWLRHVAREAAQEK